MKDTIRYGIILLLFAAIAGGVLAVVNGFTAPVIADAELQKTLEAYEEIYGDQADEFEPIADDKLASLKEKYPDIDSVFIAKKGGETVGYGINFYAYGYGGQMTNALGLLSDKTIAGFKNIQNGETPGIGSQIEEASYRDSFTGKSFAGGAMTGSNNPTGESEVMLISGATVSSTGVLKSLNTVLSAYDEISAE